MFDFLLGAFDKPRWKEEFESRIYDLEYRTGIKKEKLMELANVLEEMKIIKL